MQSVRTKDTGPELAVRRWLHRHGYRYRLHNRKLPGTPDIVFGKRKLAIFVHGCFWHGHECQKGKAPKSKLDYWGPKLRANCERDERKAAELRALGWNCLTIWQCQTKDEAVLEALLKPYLEEGKISIDKVEPRR